MRFQWCLRTRQLVTATSHTQSTCASRSSSALKSHPITAACPTASSTLTFSAACVLDIADPHAHGYPHHSSLAYSTARHSTTRVHSMIDGSLHAFQHTSHRVLGKIVLSHTIQQLEHEAVMSILACISRWASSRHTFIDLL